MSSSVYANNFEEEAVSRHDELEMELKIFLQETPTDHTVDVFQWWASNVSRFPNLSELARKTLPIPATSVASERVFSRSGQVVSDRRNRLKPEHTEMLVCISLNLK